MGGLDSQVAVVFGASSGIGLETARAFAAEGATVVLAARRAELVTAEAERLSLQGATAIGLGADVGVRAEVDAVVSAAQARFGRIDVLVNAAGINTKERTLTNLTDATFQALIQTNLTGAYYTIQSVLPVMREQNGGLIIQISSVSGRFGDHSGAAYQASKHGMIGLCYAVMAEERGRNIRATALMPGLVDTPLLKYRPVQPTQETLSKAMQPEDIAQMCLALALLPARAYVPELLMLPTDLTYIGRTDG